MIDYIIIQAGGKGTRLGHLTHNKPKGIVPVNNLPIIFNLMRQYPNRKYIVIGDYKHEVLEEYLESFCDVEYMTVRAQGKGTIAGIQDALSIIPPGNSFLVIWSDLILDHDLNIDSCTNGNYIGLSKDFECRWSFIDNKCIEQKSADRGIAGFFVFRDKAVLKELPSEGELVRWFSEHEEQMSFKEFSLEHTKEIGTVLSYEDNNQKGYTCRPFNSMEIQGETIVKRPVDVQGERLAVRERKWYEEVTKYGFDQIPKIYELNPLTMQKIDGVNIFRTKLSIDEKKKVIDNLVSSLNKLHSYKSVPADAYSIMDAYYSKTVKRLSQIRDLVPFAVQETIEINGKGYKNPYLHKTEIRDKVKELLINGEDFALIHGDCTYSNTMVDKDLNVIFLDPRGYFGKTEMYGDIYYDWAKLYYSIAGNYDRFNNKEFTLDIEEKEVYLTIESNGWEDVTNYFLQKIGGNNSTERIRFIHAIIWLSLTTYAWEDYDSICGAFYNGTMLMGEFL